ncbi:hypothetical protein ABG768_023040 [Culter alburnus]|uniref:Uncharacterized protein n=1 Tax=Culter alburnus TaxID=194366 RepID=A0AAW2AMP8_CULAL
MSKGCRIRDRGGEKDETTAETQWRTLGFPRRIVPLSFPETLTCDVLLRCPRVGFSGAVRGTQSSAHPGRTRGEDGERDRPSGLSREGRTNRKRDTRGRDRDE